MKTLYYTLKPGQPAFQVTREGPFEYHTFKQGEIYEKVPPEEINRFDILKSMTPSPGESDVSNLSSAKGGKSK
jgi:hypothetical protein